MSSKPNDKGDDEFEFIDSSQIEFVRRGRKSNIDPTLVAKLSTLPKGKAVALTSLRQDPKAQTYKTDKARVSSQIRTACQSAGIDGFRILWSPAGVPQVVR